MNFKALTKDKQLPVSYEANHTHMSVYIDEKLSISTNDSIVWKYHIISYAKKHQLIDITSHFYDNTLNISRRPCSRDSYYYNFTTKELYLVIYLDDLAYGLKNNKQNIIKLNKLINSPQLYFSKCTKSHDLKDLVEILRTVPMEKILGYIK